MQLGRSIDADGHILEPPDLWQKNLEAKFKNRTLGLARCRFLKERTERRTYALRSSQRHEFAL